MTRKEERALDRALSGETKGDNLEVLDLVETASDLRGRLEVEAPEARVARAAFVAGAAGVGRARSRRILVPVVAMLILAAMLVIAARSALPGDAFYPVRRVLGGIGLAESADKALEKSLASAEMHLEDAEDALEGDRPKAAIRFALRAAGELYQARALLPDVASATRSDQVTTIDGMEARVVQIITSAQTPPSPEASPSPNDDGDDDSSGPGSDDSGSDDSGSDDSGSDDSGSDDEGGDDSAGSGSGDDSSGSGSGDSDGGSDSSGSGDDDSSGPGSGDDLRDD